MSTSGLWNGPHVDNTKNGHLWNKYLWSTHMDLADVHAWTLPRSMTRSTCGHCTNSPHCGPQNRNVNFLKNRWLWRDLNPSPLHGSPVPNQLDHEGQLNLQIVYCSLYLQFLRIQKNGPCMVHAGTFLGSSEEVPARTFPHGPHLARPSQWPWESWRLQRSVFSSREWIEWTEWNHTFILS